MKGDEKGDEKEEEVRKWRLIDLPRLDHVPCFSGAGRRFAHVMLSSYVCCVGN